MVFWLIVMIATGGTLLALPQWRGIQPQHAWVIAGIAVSGFIGQWTLTEAFRMGESSFIAPFEYTALAWGMTFDWLVWRTAPQVRTLAGAVLIIACGVYLIRREREVHPEGDAHNPAGLIGGDAAVE
jgi:drug/metabolite transporter (DMT)-like permease